MVETLQQLDQEVQAKEQEYIRTYRLRDISCDTCNMLIENLKSYYDKERDFIVNKNHEKI